MLITHLPQDILYKIFANDIYEKDIDSLRLVSKGIKVSLETNEFPLFASGNILKYYVENEMVSMILLTTKINNTDIYIVFDFVEYGIAMFTDYNRAIVYIDEDRFINQKDNELFKKLSALEIYKYDLLDDNIDIVNNVENDAPIESGYTNDINNKSISMLWMQMCRILERKKELTIINYNHFLNQLKMLYYNLYTVNTENVVENAHVRTITINRIERLMDDVIKVMKAQYADGLATIKHLIKGEIKDLLLEGHFIENENFNYNRKEMKDYIEVDFTNIDEQIEKYIGFNMNTTTAENILILAQNDENNNKLGYIKNELFDRNFYNLLQNIYSENTVKNENITQQSVSLLTTKMKKINDILNFTKEKNEKQQKILDIAFQEYQLTYECCIMHKLCEILKEKYFTRKVTTGGTRKKNNKNNKTKKTEKNKKDKQEKKEVKNKKNKKSVKEKKISYKKKTN